MGAPPVIRIDRTGFSPARARRQALDAIRSTVRSFAWDIKRHMMADFRAPKHGRAYRRGGGRIHIASAPGEAPAIDTGRLDASLAVIFGSETGGYWGSTGTDVIYGAYLEAGSPDTNLAKRPFAKPAADAVRQDFVDAIRASVIAALNGESSPVVSVIPVG